MSRSVLTTPPTTESHDTFDAITFSQIKHPTATTRSTTTSWVLPGEVVFHDDTDPSAPMEEIHAFDLSSVIAPKRRSTGSTSKWTFLNKSLAVKRRILNKLTRALSNVESQGSILAGARSKIRDADFAAETAGLAKAQIPPKSSTAVLAQAKRMNEGAIRLLS